MSIGRWNDKNISCDVLPSKGRSLCLSTPSLLSGSAEKIVNLELRNADGDKLIDGDWLVDTFHEHGNGFVYQLTRRHPAIDESIDDLLDFCSDEVLFRKDRFAIFEKADAGAFFERVCSEIKTAPVKIRAKFHSKTQDYATHFAFSEHITGSGRMIFSHELSIDLPSIGSRVIGEFHWLGCSYVFSSEVSNTDKTLGLISVERPSYVLAFISRNFHRVACKQEAQLRLPHEGPRRVELKKISPIGGEIHCEETLDLSRITHFELIQPVTEPVQCRAIAPRGSSILSFAFERPQSNAVRKLLNHVSRDLCCIRSPDNYDEFLDFYCQVGYGPKDETQRPVWRQKTIEAWQILDRALPGNTLGGPKDGPLSTSISILPISEKAVCGHSIAMVKTASSIEQFLHLARVNLTWTALFPGVEYYVSSARLRSRFSTRVHLSFEDLPSPSRVQTIPALAVLQQYPSQDSQVIELVPMPPDEILPLIPQSLSVFYENVSTPHPILKDWHSVATGCLKSLSGKGEVFGYYAAHSAPEYFTAVNLYRCILLVLTAPPPQPLEQLVSQVRQDLELPGYEVDIICHNADWFAPLVDEVNEPLFYYQFHRDDLGAVSASITRTIYSVLRKYGEEGMDGLKRLLQ